MPLPAIGPLLGVLIRSVAGSALSSGARAVAAGAVRRAGAAATGSAAGASAANAARAGAQITLAQQVKAAGFESGVEYTLEQIGRKLGTPRPSDEQVTEVRRQQQKSRDREAFEELTSSVRRAAKATAALGSIPAVAYSVGTGLERFGSLLLHRQQDLRQFGTGIATAFAQLERQQVVLQARRASATSGTTQSLAQSIMELRENIAPFREAITNIWNSIGTLFTRLANLLITILEHSGILTILEGIAWMLEWVVGDQRSRNAAAAGLQGDLRNFFSQLQRGNFGRPISQTPGADGLF